MNLNDDLNNASSLWTRLMTTELKNIKLNPQLSESILCRASVGCLDSINYDYSKVQSTGEALLFYLKVCNYIEKHSTDDFRRLNYFIDDLSNGDVSMKSLKKAKQFRQQGNNFFKMEDYLASASSYRSGLLYVPGAYPLQSSSAIDDQVLLEIALLHGNLSASLFKQFLWLECLQGILLAFKFYVLHQSNNKMDNYKIIEKLKLRMMKCFEYLNFEVGDEICNRLNTNHIKLNIIITEIEKLIIDVEMKNKLSVVKLNEFDEAKIVHPRYDFHNECKGLSSGVKLENTQSKGRHIIATQDFNVGDAIAVEPAGGWNNQTDGDGGLLLKNAFVLLPSERMNRCCKCFEELKCVHYACPYCCDAAYCCLPPNADWNAQPLWHLAECRFMFLLNSIGLGHLCFRLAWSSPRLIDNISQLSAINDLVDNFDQFHCEDLVQYALTSWLIAQLLVASSKRVSYEWRLQDRTLIGLWCFDTLRRLQCNAHAIVDVRLTSPTWHGHDDWIGSVSFDNLKDERIAMQILSCFEQVRIATSIYPSVSMLNHSCDPNVISEFQNSLLTLHCLRPIQSGDEIVNCYGPHYLHNPHCPTRRTELLEQYYFMCDCNRCLTGPNQTGCQMSTKYDRRIASKWKEAVDNLRILIQNPEIKKMELVQHFESFSNVLMNENDNWLSLLYSLWPNRDECLGNVFNQIGKRLLMLAFRDADKRTMGFSCLIASIQWTRLTFGSNSIECFWESINCLRLLVLTDKNELSRDNCHIPSFEFDLTLYNFVNNRRDKKVSNDALTVLTSTDLFNEVKRLSTVHFNFPHAKLKSVLRKFVFGHVKNGCNFHF